ncbi:MULTISPECIES: InlB B-repeat-containing protein [unclassified Carboxylicivirga]|uniref:InlB B-repeat-containing protein n=1 Tax=Carboxylicivirga TaxID=1628153 RepID=UPI003D344DE0
MKTSHLKRKGRSLAKCGMLVLLSIFFTHSTIDAQSTTETQAVKPTIGDGSTENPWHIEKLAHLRWLSEETSAKQRKQSYTLLANIDAAETKTWNGAKGFQPIDWFEGRFMGNGHTISNLYINRPDEPYVGLFSQVSDATLKGLVLESVDISGGEYVGALAGSFGMYTEMTKLKQCSASGKVTGKNYVGGLLGSTLNACVEWCYAKVEVTGEFAIGGFSGRITSWALVQNCFTQGDVYGPNDKVGGFVGLADYNGQIKHCYSTTPSVGFGSDLSRATIIDSYFVGEGVDEGATGLSPEQMADQQQFEGWDFTGVWGMAVLDELAPGQTLPYFNWQLGKHELSIVANQAEVEVTGDGHYGLGDQVTLSAAGAYPFLHWECKGEVLSTEPTYRFTFGHEPMPVKAVFGEAMYSYGGGDGTSGNPFQIDDYTHLLLLSYNMADWEKGCHYELTADIDMTPLTFSKGFLPIGNGVLFFSRKVFKGQVNGNFKTISNLIVNRPDFSKIGLFGKVDASLIRNIGLENATVNGQSQTGALVGEAVNTLVLNCYATGIVTGEDELGGLIGVQKGSNSFLKNSYADVQVNGKNSVGGLIGSNGGEIDNAYAHGEVIGYDCVGGLIGKNYLQQVGMTYASGAVTGTGKAGALVGSNPYGAAIHHSYYLECALNNGIGQPLAEDAFALATSFPGWDFQQTWTFVARNSTSGQQMYPAFLWQTGLERLTIIPNCKEVELIGAGHYKAGTKVELWATGAYAFSHWEQDGVKLSNQNPFIYTLESGGATINAVFEPEIYPLGSGQGTPEAPYQLGELTQLLRLAYDPLLWDKHFVLTQDIDMSTYQFPLGFKPIGSANLHPTINYFSGTLAGNGNAIRNLYINRSEESDIGLFANIHRSQIYNIALLNGDLKGYNNVGMLAGCKYDSKLTNIECSGSVQGRNYVGGVWGKDLTSYPATGSSNDTEQVRVEVSVTGNIYVGGVAGLNQDKIQKAAAFAQVNGVNGVGGLVGTNRGNLENSFVFGKVKGKENIGGCIGNHYYYSAIINCYALVDVTGINTDETGGLVGYMSDPNDIVSSYRKEGVGGVNNTYGTALAAADFAQQAKFIGWDFKDVWVMWTDDNGIRSPRLRYQLPGLIPVSIQVDGGRQQPLAGVQLNIPSVGQFTTDEQGKVQLELHAGDYRATISANGYPAMEKTFAVSATEASFALNLMPVEYTITYQLNGGVNAEGNVASYTIEDKTMSLQPATRAGYVFKGWYNNAEFTGEQVATIPQGSTGDYSLYAKWELISYDITYHLNGGVNADGNAMSYTIEDETLSLQPATRAGYAFRGWFSNAEFTGEQVTTIPQGSTGHYALYAKWELISYGITYQLNGGVNADGNMMNYTIEDETLSLQPATRAGYAFKGWYNNAEFTGEQVTTIPQGSTGDYSLYAKWELISYDITYHLNGGVNADENVMSYTIEDETLSLLPATRAGYVFKGWYCNAEFRYEQVTTIPQGRTGDFSLYAKWELITYSITYQLNGGTNSMGNPLTYTVEDATWTVLPPAARAAYEFMGWYANPDFTSEVITTISQGSTGDMELFAKWEPIAYIIIYQPNGGVNAEGNPIMYTIVDGSISLQPATRDGYAFKGWFGNAEFTGEQVTTIPQGSTGHYSLYAKWELISYGITYHLNGGVNADGSVMNYTIEDEPLSLQPATRDGYVFKGWYNNADFTGEEVTTIPQGSTGDRVLFAKWELSTSVSELEETSKLYPNPASGSVNIEAEANTLVVFYNVSGQLVKQVVALGGAEVISIADLKPGLYIVRLGDEHIRLLVK